MTRNSAIAVKPRDVFRG